MNLFIFIIIFLSLSFQLKGQYVKLKIGAIFDQNSDDLVDAFEKAIELQNPKTTNVTLTPSIKRIISSDTLKVQAAACELLEEGVFAIVGPGDNRASGIVSAICKEFKVPHIVANWRSPTEIEDIDNHNFTINVFPKPDTLSRALYEILQKFNWKEFSVVYENEDSLTRLNDILQNHELFGKKISIYRLPSDNDYKPFLKYLSKTGINYFIVDCSVESWLRFLQQGDQFNMTKKYINYFLTGFDMYTLGSQMELTEANITMIRFVDTDSNALPNFVRRSQAAMEIQNFKTKRALIIDAVQVAMSPFIGDNSLAPRTHVRSISCSQTYQRFDDGEAILEAIKNEFNSVERHGMITGSTHFDDIGQRDEFFLEVLEFTNKKIFEQIAKWENGKDVELLRPFEDLEKQNRESLQNKTIQIVSRLVEPFLMKAPQNGSVVLTGNDRYMGFAKDLADRLAKKLNANYTLVVLDKVGDNKNGPWDGVIGELVNRRADMAITDLTITHLRRSAIDFTSAFMVLGIDILLLKVEKEERGLFSFMEPLSLDVWMHMATAFLVISIVIRVLARMAAGDWENPHPCDEEPEELENIWNMHNCIWLSVGSIMQQGCDILPKAVPTRLAAGIWWFFALIVISSYTANLAAFLTKEMAKSEINSVDALAKQNKIKYGLMKGGSTEAFFRDSEYPLYRRMWNVMDADPTVLVGSTDEGIEQVLNRNGKYAFFMESTTIDYHKEQICNLTRTQKPLDSKGYGIGMPKGSKYRTLFSETLLTLNEDNTVRALKNLWWTNRNNQSCKDKIKVDSATPELSMENVGGVFLVLGAGIVLAIIMGAIEFFWNVRQVSIDEKITPCEALKKELVFACKVWITRKPIEAPRESGSTDDEESFTGSRKEIIHLASVERFD